MIVYKSNERVTIYTYMPLHRLSILCAPLLKTDPLFNVILYCDVQPVQCLAKVCVFKIFFDRLPRDEKLFN